MIASRGATMAVDWEQRIDFAAAAHRPPRAGARRAAGVRPRRGAALRPEQHPLRHEHAHRRVGARQERALRAAAARGRSGPVGLRLGGAPSPALRAVAARDELAGRRDEHARRDAASRPACRTCSPATSSTCCASTGSSGEPLGIDLTDMETLASLQRGGASPTADAQPVMLEARKIKTADEIALLDHAAGDRRRRLRADLRAAAPGRARAPDRRGGAAAAVRARLRAGRGDQRRLRRPLQPAPARLLRPAAAPGRPGVLRHHPLVHGLPDVLLPHVLRGRRHASPSSTPTSSAASGSTRRSSSSGPGVTTDQIAAVWPTRAGARLPERGGVLRPAVRPRPRGRSVRVADDLAPALASSDPVEIEEGMVFALETYCAGVRRALRGADRGGGRGHRRRRRDPHPLPGRGAARRRHGSTCAAPTCWPTSAHAEVVAP